MKGLLFLACMVGLTGCQKAINADDVDDAQKRLTYRAYDQYLDQFNQKGTSDKVFHNFEVNGKYFSLDMTTSMKFKCSDQLALTTNDVEKYSGNFAREDEYYVKDDVVIDYKPFNRCIDKQLDSIPLSYKNLMVFSNDPDVQKYKETDPAITDLITQAKADESISYLEALNIYMAVNKQREKDIFNQL